MGQTKVSLFTLNSFFVAVGGQVTSFALYILGVKTKEQSHTCKKKKDKRLQLDKYETAPNFIQLNQNLTSDCLLI